MELFCHVYETLDHKPYKFNIASKLAINLWWNIALAKGTTSFINKVLYSIQFPTGFKIVPIRINRMKQISYKSSNSKLWMISFHPYYMYEPGKKLILTQSSSCTTFLHRSTQLFFHIESLRINKIFSPVYALISFFQLFYFFIYWPVYIFPWLI